MGFEAIKIEFFFGKDSENSQNDSVFFRKNWVPYKTTPENLCLEFIKKDRVGTHKTPHEARTPPPKMTSDF